VNPGSGREKIQIRDGKSRIRDKHPKSATLPSKTTNRYKIFTIFLFLFQMAHFSIIHNLGQDPVLTAHLEPEPDSVNPDKQHQGCGSALIWSGSGANLSGWIPIRIHGFDD
jgi:hypothetical protein